MTEITKEAIEAAKSAYWHEAHNGGGYGDKCYEAALTAALPFLAPIAGDQEAQKREALLRAERITAPEDDQIRDLCERIGYGAVMDSAARQWAKKDPIGAFYIGGCIGSIPSSPGKDGGQEVEAVKVPVIHALMGCGDQNENLWCESCGEAEQSVHLGYAGLCDECAKQQGDEE